MWGYSGYNNTYTLRMMYDAWNATELIKYPTYNVIPYGTSKNKIKPTGKRHKSQKSRSNRRKAS